MVIVKRKIIIRSFYLVILFIGSFMLVAVDLIAGVEKDMDDALSAVKNKEYEKAYIAFKQLAESGVADAQYNLAMMYRTGQGVNKDISLSNTWFGKAANQGVADAQYYLGHLYDTGNGVAGNKKTAFDWYLKAAEKGHGLAQINLGVLYANGLGVERDIEQAYLWFHIATAQGYKVAFENKEIIEKSLDQKVLEKLKQKSRDHFRKFVQPYQRNSSSNTRLQ